MDMNSKASQKTRALSANSDSWVQETPFRLYQGVSLAERSWYSWLWRPSSAWKVGKKLAQSGWFGEWAVMATMDAFAKRQAHPD